MRPIDADALALETKRWFVIPDNRKTMKDAIDHAETLDYVPRQQWISVDEEYPEDLKLVLLAYADNGYVDIGYYDESFAEWDDLSDSKILRPTHWMPLPKPPKEG